MHWKMRKSLPTPLTNKGILSLKVDLEGLGNRLPGPFFDGNWNVAKMWLLFRRDWAQLWRQ